MRSEAPIFPSGANPDAYWRILRGYAVFPVPPNPRPGPMTASADPRYCPLCGQPNLCAMELARRTGLPPAPCWCMAQTIDPDTLAQIPLQALDKACLCPACAALPAGSTR